MRSGCWILVFLLTTACLTIAQHAHGAEKAAQSVNAEHAQRMAQGLKLFRERVRTLLQAKCVHCHGGEMTKSGFDLTSREGLLKGGANGPVVQVGDRAKVLSSKLYQAITHQREPIMPQKAAKLTDRQIEELVRWLSLGAPYDRPLAAGRSQKDASGRTLITEEDRQFWSYQPLRAVSPPSVKTANWARTPIDRFILAALEAKGIVPNAPADRRTLIRRAYFDLIGLPPTPAQVRAFVEDRSPDAWQNVLDELLASPHYGERWGRHWLDVARFGESHGFEQDYDRPHAYHYRDFVIKALNMDMPYDQFVRWQLAGDEFAPDNPLAMTATGFLGAGVFPTQLTEKEFESARYDELDDMVNTMGNAMLGLSIGCARCHDHKFDPIPAHDYYSLVSTFTTTIRSDIDLPISGPETEAAYQKWQAEHKPILAARARFEKETLPKRLDQWLAQDHKEDKSKPAWEVLKLNAKSHGGASFKDLGDGSLLATDKSPPNDKWTIQATTQAVGITAVKLEVLTHPTLKRNGPGRASNGNFALSIFRITAQKADGTAKPVDVKLVTAKATHQQNTGSLSVASAIDADRVSGWAVDFGGIGKNQAAVFEFAQPTGWQGGTKLIFHFEFNNNVHHSIGRPRLSVTTRPRPVAIEGTGQPADIAALLAKAKTGGRAKLSAKDQQKLLTWYRQRDAQWLKFNAAVVDHQRSKPVFKTVKAMVTSEGVKPMKHHADGRGFPHFYKNTYHLKRGDPNQKGPIAKQGFLQVMMRGGKDTPHWQVAPPADSSVRTSYRRRSLANWITDTEHGAGHLLARVIVNRLWQHHFGQGIVATPNDFGFQGQRPTHPELLDWLANELIRNGWRLKAMHKLMLSSAVYTQSSQFDSADAQKDPQNKLLWRWSPRRLEGEVIRDAMLAASGKLDRTMFGKGTLNEGMTRRSIYFFIKRSRLVPTLALFDMPEPLVSQGDRPSTTIAPQALHFLNNPHVRGYAAALAQQLDQPANRPLSDILAVAYETVLGRPPTQIEQSEDIIFVKEQMSSYQTENKGNARALALRDLCQGLFALNEFVYLR